MKQSAIILQTNFSTIKQNYVNEIQYNKSIILMIVELTNQIKRKKQQQRRQQKEGIFSITHYVCHEV